MIYNGSPQSATLAITAQSVPGSVANVLTGGAATQTNAATYAVTADFVPNDTTNYNTLIGLAAGDFVIQKATPSATLAVNNSPVTYNGNPQSATVAISASSVPGAVANITNGTHTNAGTYAVTADFVPTDTDNYNTLVGLAAGDFEIDQLEVTITPTDSQSKIYGDADPVFTYGVDPVLAPGDSFTGQLSRVAGETVGLYDITQGTLELNSNYVLVFIGGVDFKIKKKDASVSPDAASKTYGDSDPVLSGTLVGFLAGDGVTATYSRVAGETVTGGPYTISASLVPVEVLSNYNITHNTANFTINTKSASVTPDAATKEYGSGDPALTGTLSGFLAADSVTAVYSRAAGETVLGGPYTISAVLSPVGVLSNYAITYNTAAFTITPKAATWTTNANSKIFGQPDPIPLTTGSGSGFLLADGVTATYTRAPGEAVGNYLITATLSPSAVLSNYTITNAGANFAITAWTLNGYYQPVGIPNTYPILTPSPFVWNTIKGGQTVPLKFNVFAGTVEQTSTAIAAFSVYEIGCASSGTGSEDPVDFTTTGGTSFRYSGTPGVDGQFIQNWQSPNGPNKCYRVVTTTADGSRLVAFFKTKK